MRGREPAEDLKSYHRWQDVIEVKRFDLRRDLAKIRPNPRVTEKKNMGAKGEELH